MKKQLLKSALVVVAGIGLLAGAASADTTFSVDSSFTGVIGSATDLTWSVSEVASIPNFKLAPNGTVDIVYGSFTTNDFSLDSKDLSNNTDSFTAKLIVVPPDANFTGLASVDGVEVEGKYFWSEDEQKITVNFDNTWQTVTFGNGGKYEYRFNDTEITSNGSENLTASFKLDSDASPVPEPATMLLFGTGILGLAAAGRRKINK